MIELAESLEPLLLIITYLLLGISVVLFLILGFLIWQYQKKHKKKKTDAKIKWQKRIESIREMDRE